MRIDNRRNNELRPIKITPGFLDYPEGSVLIEAGKTRVVCAVTVQPGIPKWLNGQNQGWLTAEYAMLPRATHTRTPRETTPSSRSQEIKRLIGRSLRAAVDLNLIGEHTITSDQHMTQWRSNRISEITRLRWAEVASSLPKKRTALIFLKIGAVSY